MSHYALTGGPFERVEREFLGAGNAINWQSSAGLEAGKPKTKRESKQKYQCPLCGLNAWAKPGARLTCGDCELEMIEA